MFGDTGKKKKIVISRFWGENLFFSCISMRTWKIPQESQVTEVDFLNVS